jgi:hypothetical protein
MDTSVSPERYRILLWPGSEDWPPGTLEGMSDQELRATATVLVVETEDLFTALVGLCQEYRSVSGNLEELDDPEDLDG